MPLVSRLNSYIQEMCSIAFCNYFTIYNYFTFYNYFTISSHCWAFGLLQMLAVMNIALLNILNMVSSALVGRFSPGRYLRVESWEVQLLLLFSLTVVSDSATPWTAARLASLSFTISQSLLKLMAIESVMPSNHLILCRPLLLLPSIFPSIRIFSNKLALRIRRPKYWSFTFSISPSSEYLGLISFRIDWFDLVA